MPHCRRHSIGCILYGFSCADLQCAAVPCEYCGLRAGEGVGLRLGELRAEKFCGAIEKLQIELARP